MKKVFQNLFIFSLKIKWYFHFYDKMQMKG